MATLLPNGRLEVAVGDDGQALIPLLLCYALA
jgi:hypothetical protein